MPPEGDPEGKFDDLFDDMDRFFEDEGNGKPGADTPAHAGEGPSAEAAAASEGAGPEDAEDILPAGWQDVADIDFAASTGERPDIEAESGTSGTLLPPLP